MRLNCVEIVEAIGGRLERRWCATGVSSDSRTVKPGDLFFALAGDNFDAHDYVPEALEKGAVGAVISREVDLPDDVVKERCVMVGDTRRALGDLAAYYIRRWNGRTVAITGSNGKTTTKDMTHHLLSDSFTVKKANASFNNDIGVPHTIFQLEPEDQVAVLEMGTNAHGEIRRLAQIASPNIGVITNIGPSHLEKLGSIPGVARAKGELLENLAERGIAVLNADDPMTPWLMRRCEEFITYGLSENADVRAVNTRMREWGSEFSLGNGRKFRLNVPGKHNVMNALAALSVCRLLDMSINEAAERLEGFGQGDMRLAREEVGGVEIINDAYNANMGSMRAALDVFASMQVEGRRFMICADMLELGAKATDMHKQLGREIADAEIDALITIGVRARFAGETFRQESGDGRAFHFGTAAEAGQAAAGMLRPGDALLVKGSRGMRLEDAVKQVRAALQDNGTLAADRQCANAARKG